MDIIQSRQNPLIKQIQRLAQQRRARADAGQTVLEGEHLIRAALEAGLVLDRLLIAEDVNTRPDVVALAERWAGTTTLVDARLFPECSGLETPDGLLAIARIPPPPTRQLSGTLLLLDGVQDPGNTGTLLRTAAAAGVNQVWLGPGCADIWSPKVLRAGMGAQFVLPCLERVDLLAALQTFPGRLAVTQLADSTDLFDTDLCGDLALVMGSEGQGVSAPLLTRADIRLRIPMVTGSVESLNVAAAAAICLYERWRQLRR